MREINKGDVINGRYRVEASLGRGGMAEVYKVWDQQRSVYLAMKVLRQDLAQDPIFLRRFQREAHSLAKLQHPNIVRFYGLERDDLLAYLLMEYVDGVSLQAEILRGGSQALPGERIQEVMSTVCPALHYAHAIGIVHCDIKPGNILIDKNGHIYLTDFGIARGMDSATSTMVGIGTPAYMAPEVIKGEDPGPQTDIYSLGVVLYEMLTGGERPFIGEKAGITGTTAEKVRWEQVNQAPRPPRDYNPSVSPEMERVVLRCLAKEPRARFASAADLQRAVEQAAGSQRPAAVARAESRPQPVRPAAPYSAAALKDIPAPQPALGQVNKGPGKGLWVFIGVIALAAAVGLGAIAGRLSSREQPARAAKNPLARAASATPTSRPTPTPRPAPRVGSAERASAYVDDSSIPMPARYTFMSGSQPLIVYRGWQAIDFATLADNLVFIQPFFSIDGEPIPAAQISSGYKIKDDSVLQQYYVLLEDWPEGSYDIENSMAITETIHDGWDEFEPQEFNAHHFVTVTAGSSDEDFTNWPILYYDDFSRDSGDWWTGSLSRDWYRYDGETTITNGLYAMEIDYADDSATFDRNMPGVFTSGDFYLSATVWSDVEEGAVGCSGLRFLDYYDFQICDDGTYEVWYGETGGESLVDWTDSWDINRDGRNEIGVLHLDGMLTFFINGDPQVDIAVQNKPWGEIGVEVTAFGLPASFYFDDITLRMP